MVTSLECKKYEKLVMEFLDKELDEDGIAKVEEHSASCSRCSEYLAKEKEFNNSLSNYFGKMKVSQKNQNLRTMVHEDRLQYEENEAKSLKTHKRLKIEKYVSAGIFAACLLIFTITTYNSMNTGSIATSNSKMMLTMQTNDTAKTSIAPNQKSLKESTNPAITSCLDEKTNAKLGTDGSKLIKYGFLATMLIAMILNIYIEVKEKRENKK